MLLLDFFQNIINHKIMIVYVFPEPDKPVKQLQPNAAAMARYLLGRQRPLERADLRAKAKEFASIQGVNGMLRLSRPAISS